MIIYDEDAKILIIPNGLGNLTIGGDAKLQEKAYSPQSAQMLKDVILPDPDYDGISRVEVDLTGYNVDAVQKGEMLVKGRVLGALRELNPIQENGSYEIYDGATVVVDVPQSGDRYEEGKIDGKREQEAIDLAKLEERTFTQNGEYEASFGYKKVIVNVEDSPIKLQDKTVDVDANYMEVFTDEGYDAIGKVTIDAIAFESRAWNSGYGQGKEEGIWMRKDYGKLGNKNVPIPMAEGFNSFAVIECTANGVLTLGGNTNESEYNYGEESVFDAERKETNHYYHLEGPFREGLFYPVWFNCPDVVNDWVFDDGYMTSLVLPSNVTRIGERAFQDNELEAITCYAMNAPFLEDYALRGNHSNGELRVPQGAQGYETWLQRLGDGWTIKYI